MPPWPGSAPGLGKRPWPDAPPARGEPRGRSAAEGQGQDGGRENLKSPSFGFPNSRRRKPFRRLISRTGNRSIGHPILSDRAIHPTGPPRLEWWGGRWQRNDGTRSFVDHLASHPFGPGCPPRKNQPGLFTRPDAGCQVSRPARGGAGGCLARGCSTALGAQDRAGSGRPMVIGMKVEASAGAKRSPAGVGASGTARARGVGEDEPISRAGGWG